MCIYNMHFVYILYIICVFCKYVIHEYIKLYYI